MWLAVLLLTVSGSGAGPRPRVRAAAPSAARLFLPEPPGARGRFGLIVNGDSQRRHVGNVSAYARHLSAVFGVAEENVLILCSACPGRLGPATASGLERALSELSRRLNPGDALFVYTTGHGERGARRSLLVLENGETISDGRFADGIRGTGATRLHYFGDQCYSGGFAAALGGPAAGPARDVVAIAAAGADTSCACQEFTPAFLEAYAHGADDRGAFALAGRHAQEASKRLPTGVFLNLGASGWTDALRGASYVSWNGSLGLAVVSDDGPQKAPDLEGRDLVRDRVVRLSEIRRSVVLLDFWATWCPPCRRELPDLVKLQRAHRGEGFTVIGVTQDEPARSVLAVMRRERIRYPVLSVKGDPEGYETDAIPFAVLIDCRGRIVKSYRGQKDPEQLESDVSGVIARCAGRSAPPIPSPTFTDLQTAGGSDPEHTAPGVPVVE